MNTISGVIIAKDEEDIITDCFKSISFCDEIIVIDNNSKDRTKTIAEKMGARVFELKTDDFSRLRNEGLENAKSEWILYIDADERVTDDLRREIKEKIEHAGKYAAFRIKRKNFYLGSSKKNEWPYAEKIERLFKKEFLKGWRGRLHESPVVDGKVGELDGLALHYTHRDLTSMVDKTLGWSKTEAELRFDSNHPKITWWRFPRVMISAFVNSYIIQGGWRVGTAGLVESIYQAFSIFITYARLWEKQLKMKNEK